MQVAAPVPGLTRPVVTVVVPTFNERENDLRIVGELVELDIRYLTIVVVGDNSADGTSGIADEFAKRAGESGEPVAVVSR